MIGGNQYLMFEFKGIDLSTKYITPSTWDWLASWADCDDSDTPMDVHVYDGGYGILIWTYSADMDDDRIPDELANIISEAQSREWRFIVLDADGADCELFPSYEEEWPA